jgi:hypothetical protein
MSELATNAFGEQVTKPVHAWKPIAQMDRSERAEYNRLRAADSRKKKKLAEELAEEKKRLEEQQAPNKAYAVLEAERSSKSTPGNWERTIWEKAQPIIAKVSEELDEWYYPRRCDNGNWIPGLHGLVDETINTLGAIVFGVPEKFFQIDGLGFRVAGYFPDSVMHEAVRQDKSILSRSKNFRDFYEQALRQTVKLLDDPRYKEYMEYGPAIRNELQNLHNDIQFA